MRTFERRIYSLRTPEALHRYAETVYPRHLRSMPLFGVELHGFWTKEDDRAPRLYVLVSYAEGDDPAEVTDRYLRSSELFDDTRGFDTADITGVETTVLIPMARSPLT